VTHYVTYYVQIVGIKKSDWTNEKSVSLFLYRSVRKLFMYRAESSGKLLIVWGDIYCPTLYAQGMKT
jgi:hypothetical protein